MKFSSLAGVIKWAEHESAYVPAWTAAAAASGSTAL